MLVYQRVASGKIDQIDKQKVWNTKKKMIGIDDYPEGNLNGDWKQEIFACPRRKSHPNYSKLICERLRKKEGAYAMTA